MSVSGKPIQPIREPKPEAAGDVRIYHETIVINTSSRFELLNITDRISELIEKSGIRRGFVNLSSLHTTVCLLAELDGPRERGMAVQVVGTA
jgi:thiamine phosphate synthase YjbQ (UPF0047 family)